MKVSVEVVEIRDCMQGLIEGEIIKGHMEGPKNNVLVCDTMADYCIASGELVHKGYGVFSPGGFAGGSPSARSGTWNKIWREGSVCALVIERKVLIFKLPQTVNDYCEVVIKNKR